MCLAATVVWCQIGSSSEVRSSPGKPSLKRLISASEPITPNVQPPASSRWLSLRDRGQFVIAGDELFLDALFKVLADPIRYGTPPGGHQILYFRPQLGLGTNRHESGIRKFDAIMCAGFEEPFKCALLHYAANERLTHTLKPLLFNEFELDPENETVG